MLLSRNRIWGNVIGEGVPSGYKILKKPVTKMSRKVGSRYDNFDLHTVYPFFKNFEALNYKKEKYSDRKMRIFMRGMKIGIQKGAGKSMDAMSVFEMTGSSKKSKAEMGQKLGEASFSDDSLGISSSDKEWNNFLQSHKCSKQTKLI